MLMLKELGARHTLRARPLFLKGFNMPADPLQAHVAKDFKNPSPLVSCRFDPLGRYVFAGTQSNKVVRWSLADGKATEFGGHDSWVRGLAFAKTKDGDKDVLLMISGGYDGRVIIWNADAETPEPIRKIDAHAGWVRALVVLPDQAHVVSCGNDNKVKLWRIADGMLVREFIGHESHVYNVALHPDGKQLVSGDLKANLIHWDLDTGKQLRTFKSASLHKYDEGFWADIGGYRELAFSPDGKFLAGCGITNVTNAFAGVGNAAVAEFNWAEGKEVVVHLAKTAIQGNGWGMVWHPKNFLIGLSGGGGGGVLYFFKPAEKNEFHLFKLPGHARDLALSPDAMTLASAGANGQLVLTKLGPKA